jgi:hypothetical protein
MILLSIFGIDVVDVLDVDAGDGAGVGGTNTNGMPIARATGSIRPANV